MLTAKDAYKTLIAKRPDMYSESCMEYEKFYVFSLIPKGMTKVYDGLYSVDKKNGTIKAFQPFYVNKEKGKRILGYK